MGALPIIKNSVLVVGDVMEDIIVLPDGAMVPGSDVRAKIRNLPGGSGANQAMWLGTHKVSVSFLGCVGNADLAHYEARFLAGGVTPRLVTSDQLPTGKLVTLIGEDGERSFFTDRGANVALSVADCPENILDNVGLVQLSGYAFFESAPRALALHLMALAQTAGIPVSIDPASAGFLAEVGAEKFLEWTRGATMCFPNVDEAALLSGTNDIDRQMKALAAHHDLVVIKRGVDGAIAGNADGIIANVASELIEPLDSSGAGDAFWAGFIAALMAESPLEKCLARANAAGAKAAMQMGGQPS